jgi:hypothetical protein
MHFIETYSPWSSPNRKKSLWEIQEEEAMIARILLERTDNVSTPQTNATVATVAGGMPLWVSENFIWPSGSNPLSFTPVTSTLDWYKVNWNTGSVSGVTYFHNYSLDKFQSVDPSLVKTIDIYGGGATSISNIASYTLLEVFEAAALHSLATMSAFPVSLKELWLTDDTILPSVSLVGLTNLNFLYCNYLNAVTTLDFSSCSQLLRIDFQGMSALTGSSRLSNNPLLRDVAINGSALGQPIVNLMFTDLDANGQTSGSFSLSSTRNPATGSAATSKSNLITKGWTITLI